MIPTEKFRAEVERQRWSVPPEVQAALNYEVAQITAPEADGISKLERIYKTCPDHEEQRRQEVITAIFAKFKNQFEGWFVWCFADVPEDGNCVFYMKVAERRTDLEKAPTARKAFNLNLLRPREEWVIQPATFVPETPRKEKLKPKMQNAAPVKGRR